MSLALPPTLQAILDTNPNPNPEPNPYQAILDRVGVSPRNKKRIWNKNSHGGLIEEDWPEVIRPGTCLGLGLGLGLGSGLGLGLGLGGLNRGGLAGGHPPRHARLPLPLLLRLTLAVILTLS